MLNENKGKNYLIIILIFTLIFVGSIWIAKEKGLLKSPQEVLNGEEKQLGGKSDTTGEKKTDENVEGSSETKYQESLALTITSPTDGTTVSSANFNVIGKTTPGSEVFVNDKETKADTGGNFSVNITVDEGENVIVVAANDPEGNYIEKEIKVTL
jgi:hypothetical protein